MYCRQLCLAELWPLQTTVRFTLSERQVDRLSEPNGEGPSFSYAWSPQNTCILIE